MRGNAASMDNVKVTPAVLYCRVSSTRQKTEGSGLDSQEHRCRAYAAAHGYDVEAVFPDDVSGGGDFMNRPGMVALLSYLDAQRGKEYVVIFDDLKRFARDTVFHIKLRQAFAARKARVECLNFKFEDTPEGRFTETIFAAQGELEREQNRRQVLQKMQARIEKGYYVFCAPVGYRYAQSKEHGKILVRDEPAASIVQEALEGYSSGRFASQTEVRRFLESRPEMMRGKRGSELRSTFVTEILTRPTYAGYIEAPRWKISLRKGHHEPLISLETYTRNQERLAGRAMAPTRKDINLDFPLRGFVACDDCGRPMTSCWSKGRKQHYAYYLCDTRGCPSKGKSVSQAKIESGAEDILKAMQPTRGLVAVATAMFRDIWQMRLSQAKDGRKLLTSQIKEIDSQIEALLDRIVEASSASVVGAYEKRIEKLERDKLVLAEKASQSVPPQGRMEEVLDHALAFFSNPWTIYEKGSFSLKRTVLKLVFAEPLRYNRSEGYRTAETTFPFKVLADFYHNRCEMVEPRGIEPLTS